MPQLKLTRFVEIHDLAVQQNVQPNSRYWNINKVRVCSFVRQRLAAVLDRFHVYAPIPPKRGFGSDYVERVASQEVINSGGGKRRVGTRDGAAISARAMKHRSGL